MRDDSRPDVSCATPEDAFPRANYSVEGVPAPPPGWRREVIPRKTVSGADAYYYSPCGKRMRSKPDVQRFLDKSKEQGKYLDVGIESFDFATGDRRGVAVKAPERGGDATETDADGKDAPARKPAKRAKTEEPAAKEEAPARRRRRPPAPGASRAARGAFFSTRPGARAPFHSRAARAGRRHSPVSYTHLTLPTKA